ncbi:glycosyltransferase family 2 protein [Streptomyces sp. NPDC001770]
MPSYNSRNALRVCLNSLDRQVLPPGHSFDVIVVDDGSTDGTGAMVEELDPSFQLHYHYLPRTDRSGRSAARNHGIQRATGEIIAFIDADQIVAPTCVAEHLRYHELRDDLVVLGPRGDLGGLPDRAGEPDAELDFEALPVVEEDSRQILLDELSDNLNNLATCWHYFFSCNASVRREHVLAVGGFDENFKGWGLEDSELGYRLRQRGLAFAYNRDAVLHHQRGRAIEQEMYDDWRRNLAYFAARHESSEVSAQWVLDRSFNPELKDAGIPRAEELGWLECALRFEYAVRALHGRLPRVPDYRLVEVDRSNVDTVRASLEEWASDTDLLVIDHTGDSELVATAQCVRTSREFLYFRQPSARARERILARHATDVHADLPSSKGPAA